MYERLLKFALILLCLMAIIGCDSVVHKEVETYINFCLLEELPSRNVQMYFETVRVYGHCDNTIDLSWRQTSKGFDITFKGVIENNMLPAIGPATTTIDLGVLNTGTYQLSLRNEHVVLLGELFVFSDKFTIVINSNPAFNILNSPLNRIPENTIWGLVGYHTEETTPLVQSFFSELIKLGAIQKSFAPGNYNKFEIDDNGDIINYNAGFWFSQAFIFYYSEDTSDLDKFLEQWSNLHDKIMYISIYTDKGEEFFSWMY